MYGEKSFPIGQKPVKSEKRQNPISTKAEKYYFNGSLRKYTWYYTKCILSYT